MFRIHRIDHIVLRVRDIDRMLRFYQDTLGCTLELAQEDLGLYQLRAGDSLIDLVTVDGKLGRTGGAAPGAEALNLDHFCLRIEPFDPEALRGWLARHGVTPGEVARRYGAEGYGPSIYFDDPEGNLVELKGASERPA
jgi:glyoxylase I family protein